MNTALWKKQSTSTEKNNPRSRFHDIVNNAGISNNNTISRLLAEYNAFPLLSFHCPFIDIDVNNLLLFRTRATLPAAHTIIVCSRFLGRGENKGGRVLTCKRRKAAFYGARRERRLINRLLSPFMDRVCVLDTESSNRETDVAKFTSSSGMIGSFTVIQDKRVP